MVEISLMSCRTRSISDARRESNAAPATIERLEGRRLLSAPGATINFEDLAAGSLGSEGYVHESGYRFLDLAGVGTGLSGAGELIIAGPANGYTTNVLQSRQWGRRVIVSRPDGQLMDLTSFDFGAGRWGESGDFRITMHFPSGSTSWTTRSFSSSKELEPFLSLQPGIAGIEIDFAGGVNNSYGALDNFVFGDGGDGGSEGARVDFETLSLGPTPSTVHVGDFTFTGRRGDGAGFQQQFSIEAGGSGYPTKVLHANEWSQRTIVARDDGAPFDLTSFDYAAGRYGNPGDFILTGHFADGSTLTTSEAFNSKTLDTLELGWEGLSSFIVDYAGGINNAYGVVDNFIFGEEDDGNDSLVTYENLNTGPMGAGTYDDPTGFRFSDPGGGLAVFGTAHGFSSKVLQNVNWGRKLVVSRTDGGTFSLSSFDYAAGRWGEAGDATVTGFLSNGTLQTSYAFSGKALKTLSFNNWTNLTRVEINFAGGVNAAYGSVDNWVLG